MTVGSITTTRTATISESKFKWGPTEGQYRYAKLGDQEYAVLQSGMSAEDYTLRVGELWVTVKEQLVIDGSKWEEVRTKLAVPVKAGAWTEVEKRQKAREARRKGTDRPLRTWSAIGDLFRAAAADARRVVLGNVPDDPTLGAMQAEFNTGGPALLELKAKAVDTSPAGILRYFTDKGTELSRGTRDGTRLVFRSRLRPTDYDRTLLHRMEPLLVAELGGPAVKCTECDQPAVAPIEPRAWACAEHLQ